MQKSANEEKYQNIYDHISSVMLALINHWDSDISHWHFVHITHSFLHSSFKHSSSYVLDPSLSLLLNSTRKYY